MDAIDTAIRSAFEKGDPLNPAFRDRVYRSAMAAMERALETNQTLSTEAAEARRQAVAETIERIEAEFAPAAVAVNGSAPLAPEPDSRIAPPIEAERRVYAEPRLDIDAAPRRSADAPSVAPHSVEGERRSPPTRSLWRLWRWLFAAILALCVAAMLWWAFSGALLRAPQSGDAPPQDTDSAGPATAEAPATAPMLPRSESPQNWITVFSPDDPTRVSAPAGASVEVLEDDTGRFMRIRSGPDGQPVSFAIGHGVLERSAGGRVLFDIVARAEEGAPTEIAVECDFGALGDCGRKRYSANYERGDFLFDVELPDRQPAAGGAIAITSDVENAGKALDIYEIRLSVDD